jgi:hypothetical protein
MASVIRAVAGGAIVAASFAAFTVTTRSANCPLVNVNVTAVPAEVCEPTGSNNELRFFDAYSWQAFLAVVHAASATRGEPDPRRPVGTIDKPLVFETYKADWEVFANRGSKTPPPPPIAWDKRPVVTPCGTRRIAPTDLVISSFGELEELAQAGHGPSDVQGPIVTQNGQYVRYSMHYNRVLFDAIVKGKLYLASNLNGVVLPSGSVAVKSAWMILTPGVTSPERYYRRWAWVRDIARPGTCVRKQVALIALHVIQKTPKRPQWVWATFEHVSNVHPGGLAPFALHDGNPANPMPEANPFSLEHLELTPTPFNIRRHRGIHSKTVEANAAHAKALAAAGAVWRHYQLVMTQWPRSIGQPNEPGQPDFTIPGIFGTTGTSYSNPAIETFFQTPITNGCMSCHDVTRPDTDFLWSLRMRAWVNKKDAIGSDRRNLRFKQLEDLLNYGLANRDRGSPRQP